MYTQIQLIGKLPRHQDQLKSASQVTLKAVWISWLLQHALRKKEKSESSDNLQS